MFDPTSRAEDSFRWGHYDVHDRKCVCYNSTDDTEPCENVCHYLISGEVDGQGLPPVFGIDCEVEILCWGGDDIDNSTPVAYCRECVAERERYNEEQQRQQRAEHAKRRAAEEIRRVEEEQRKRVLLEFWRALSPIEFEQRCAELFTRMGYSAKLTPRSNDGAIDILLIKDGVTGAAQCKAWKQPCGVKALREFYGAMHAEGMAFGYFIARGGISRSARLLLRNMRHLECWTIDELLYHSGRAA
jgi:restriction endonuclease Mrr